MHLAEKIERIIVRSVALHHCIGPERDFQAGWRPMRLFQQPN